jgi:hypothetical protein
MRGAWLMTTQQPQNNAACCAAVHIVRQQQVFKLGSSAGMSADSVRQVHADGAHTYASTFSLIISRVHTSGKASPYLPSNAFCAALIATSTAACIHRGQPSVAFQNAGNGHLSMQLHTFLKIAAGVVRPRRQRRRGLATTQPVGPALLITHCILVNSSQDCCIEISIHSWQQSILQRCRALLLACNSNAFLQLRAATSAATWLEWRGSAAMPCCWPCRGWPCCCACCWPRKVP